MLVQEFLTRSAARSPLKVALVCDGRRLTYAELDEMSDRFGNALLAEGVRPGDRVAVHLHNCIEAVVGIFGALKAGATFVCVDSAAKPARVLRILNDCGASVLLTHTRTAAGLASDLWHAVPSLACVIVCGPNGVPADLSVRGFEDMQKDSPAAALPTFARDEDNACLVYTSGTTGEPKGVTCAHHNVDFVSTSIMSYLGNTEDDILLGVLPLSSGYGLYQLLTAVKFGGTVVLERSFTYPAHILRRIQEERATGFAGVPTIFATLLQMDRSAFDLSSLRYITSAADVLSPSHVRGLRDAFPGVALFSMYGLTETTRALYLPPDQIGERPESVGVPIPGTEAWIEDEDGHRLGAGETGELVVSGPHVMAGYWGSPEASERRFRVSSEAGARLCYTGDLFCTDEEGYFYFVGRKDDIIKCRGEKVAPREVEDVLHMLPGVSAAVVGVPDPVAGQVVKAFVVCRGDRLTEPEVIAHCRAHLEEPKVPRFVEFRDELPTTSSGKVDKIRLRPPSMPTCVPATSGRSRAL